MTSFIHVSQLTPSDLAQLGNNLPRRKHRNVPQFWHTDPIRRSLAVHEPDFAHDLFDEPADLDELFELAITGEPEPSDELQ